MAGTRAGGIRAAESNKERHGDDFYSRIGRKGGQSGHTGGFYGNHEFAVKAGRKGGKRSHRGLGGVQEFLDKNKSRVFYLYHHCNRSLPQIAETLEVGYASLLRWAHENIRDYGKPRN